MYKIAIVATDNDEYFFSDGPYACPNVDVAFEPKREDTYWLITLEWRHTDRASRVPEIQTFCLAVTETEAIALEAAKDFVNMVSEYNRSNLPRRQVYGRTVEGIRVDITKYIGWGYAVSAINVIPVEFRHMRHRFEPTYI